MSRYLDFRLAVQKFCTVLIFALALSTAISGQESQTQGDRLWFWFGDCSNPKQMGIEIAVEGRTIYRSTFHACHLRRSDRINEVQQKSMDQFYFSGGHTIQDKYHTSKGEQIEGDVWEAGADRDDIVLGVSFMTRNQELLNTIHIVKPGKATQSTLDRHVVIKTYPIAGSKS